MAVYGSARYVTWNSIARRPPEIDNKPTDSQGTQSPNTNQDKSQLEKNEIKDISGGKECTLNP